ncbi:MAG: hypothetical protein ACI4MC_01220 [Candidatus Coproplasma sp.]
MEAKKKYVMPEIEVIRFDEQDVITESIADVTLFKGIYDKYGWKDF